jgi:uncharacterized membrane-anchored protein
MTRWKRGLVALAAFAALLLLNGFAISLVTGFVAGIAQTSTVWALAAIAAAVFVAPFNLVIFRRFIWYIEGADGVDVRETIDGAESEGGEAA